MISSLNGFRFGCLWGLCFYGLHCYPIATVLYLRGQGDYRLLVYLFLVLFFAIQSGFWFLCSHFIELYSSRHMRPLITMGYFVWMQTMVFWLFDICEGYPFALPIIPIAHHERLLQLLPLMGVYGMTMALIAGQWFIACALKQYQYSLLACGCFIPFLLGYAIQKQELIPEYIKHIVYISPEWECMHPYDTAQDITYCLQKAAEQYKRGVCFIMPESAYPFSLSSYQTDLWQSVLYHNKQQIIIGAHKKSDKTSINTLFHLDQCRIIQTYEKKHSVILTERTPFYLKGIYFFTHLFGGNTDRSPIKKDKRSIYSLLIRIYNYYFLPVLCSELFYNDFSSLPYKKAPILLLCNDGWFHFYYIRYCMLLYAKIYAIRWKRPIIYISHSNGFFISETGRVVALLQ